MNVNDVRNMDQTQWVFWVTALPLTAIIIILCLVWAGELENLWRAIKSLWPSNTQRKRMLIPKQNSNFMRYSRGQSGEVDINVYYDEPDVRSIRQRRRL